MSIKSEDFGENNRSNSATKDDKDEEEFIIHMRFGPGEYSCGNDPNDIHLLGFEDSKCHIRIGDCVYIGERDKAINTSIIAQYNKETLDFDQLQVCHSRMKMERLFIKPKNDNPSNPTPSS